MQYITIILAIVTISRCAFTVSCREMYNLIQILKFKRLFTLNT